MKLRRVLIVDVETTGLDPSKDQVIEVGAILYDLEHASPVASHAAVLPAETNDAEKTNKIPVPFLKSAPYLGDVAWPFIRVLAEHSDCFAAHNASFDKSFFPVDIAALKPWVCTCKGVKWPEHGSSRALVPLALEHKVSVDEAHRALEDCRTLMRLFQRVQEKHDLSAMLERAMGPMVEVVAQVSYDDRQRAKDEGFGWDPATKTWRREMLEADVGDLGFPVRVLKRCA